GIGAEVYWLRECHQDVIHAATGSIIFRMPCDRLCLAPYAYLGGGAQFDGEDWASAHAGAGLEYRVIPHKLGLFADGRFTFFGDRFEKNETHFTLIRVGLRWVF